MRGRKPKPTALRVIEGNRGNRPLPKAEPQPTRGRPSRPRFLKGPARTEWDRVIPELDRLGLLAYLDRATLAAYCQCYGRWQMAERIIAKKGLTFVGDNGDIKQRPEVTIAQKALQLLKAYAVEFGLTPSARTRISVSQKPESKDPMENFVD